MRRLLRSHRIVASAFAAAALLLVSACAPAAGGGRPVEIPAGTAAIPVESGQTITVRADYTLEEFGVTQADLGAAMWIPSGYASEVGDVSAYFSLRDVQGATGWHIDLSRMRLERTTVTSASFGTSSTVLDLWAEVRVRVPEDAIPGVYRVRGTVHARGGAARPLSFRVEVTH